MKIFLFSSHNVFFTALQSDEKQKRCKGGFTTMLSLPAESFVLHVKSLRQSTTNCI